MEDMNDALMVVLNEHFSGLVAQTIGEFARAGFVGVTIRPEELNWESLEPLTLQLWELSEENDFEEWFWYYCCVCEEDIYCSYEDMYEYAGPQHTCDEFWHDF